VQTLDSPKNLFDLPVDKPEKAHQACIAGAGKLLKSAIQRKLRITRSTSVAVADRFSPSLRRNAPFLR
jgi:hypothetical protein